MSYKKPLIFLPQTYGPFDNPDYQAIAKKLVKYASFAFARDKYSFGILQDLLGNTFDPKKHQQAVDVAFILPASNDDKLNKLGILPAYDSSKEIFGINVSGLIANDPRIAKEKYGISINYSDVIRNVIQKILASSDGEVWLIPHVIAPRGHYESDVDACETIKEMLNDEHRKRTRIISGDYNQCDIKGVISHCDWFFGTRMHSTIASLSNCIPTSGFVYSGKFKGVFASAGQEHSVVDARGKNEQKIYDSIIESWYSRKASKALLLRDIPAVKEKAMQQMAEIAAFI